MKIRFGFVSNSSSASYIVDIKNIALSQFANEVYCEYGSSMMRTINEIIKNNDMLKSHYEKQRDNFTGIYNAEEQDHVNEEQDHINEHILNLEKENEELKALLSSDNVVQKVVDFLLITCSGIKVESFDDGVRLVEYTSIHNDYMSSMSHWLREIILYFLFLGNGSNTGKVHCVTAKMDTD